MPWALAAVSAHAQESPLSARRQEVARHRQLSERHWRFLKQGNYLSSLRILREAVRENRDPESLTFAWGNKNLAEVLAAVGSYREAQQVLNQTMPRSSSPWPPSATELKAAGQVKLEPAEELILQAARRHRIVMLNEEHWRPEHRAFGARLIPKLREAGIRYLAPETREQPPLDAAMKTGVVKIDTDPYCFEPQRAELLRAAIRAGMKVVAFDFRTPQEEADVQRDPIGGVPIREEAMARNIQEQILQKDPEAKVLVWVGMGHIAKQPMELEGRSESFMALRLWRRTGI